MPRVIPTQPNSRKSIAVLVRDPLKRHAFHSPELCEEIKGLVDVSGAQLKRERRVFLMRPPVRPFHQHAIRRVSAGHGPPACHDVAPWATRLKLPVVPPRELVQVQGLEDPFTCLDIDLAASVKLARHLPTS